MGFSELGAGLGVAASVIVAVVAVATFFHTRAARAREELRLEIESQMAGARNATTKENEAVRAQIADLARSVSEGYLRTREFESAMHSVNESIVQARREIGAVGNHLGNQISEVRQRLDRFVDKRN